MLLNAQYHTTLEDVWPIQGGSEVWGLGLKPDHLG